MSKLETLGITLAVTVGAIHGLLAAIWQLVVDQDTTGPKAR